MSDKIVPINQAVRAAISGQAAPPADPLKQRIQHQTDQMGEVTEDGRIVIYRSIRELDDMTYRHPDQKVRAIARLFLEIATQREKIRKLENKLHGQAGK